MKALFISFIFGVLLFLTTCTKEEMVPGDHFSDLSGTNIILKNVYCGKVITVSPNGFDDTENLRQAFELAKAAGTGSTVQLLKGLYTIGILEIRDFNGCFQGAGQSKTIISNKPGLPCEEEWIKNLMPSLLSFVGGKIVMSNMTFRLNDGDPCAPGPINESIYGDLCCAVILADFTTEYVPSDRQIEGVVDHVDFIAGNDGGHGTLGTPGNVAMALYCGANVGFPGDNNPLSKEKISIRNCFFDQNGAGPDLFGLDENSTVNVENNLMNSGLMQIYVAGLMGSNVTVMNNRFRNATAADLWIDENDYGYYPNASSSKRARYSLIGNDFQSPPGVISLYMTDYRRTVYPDERFPQLFDIKNNVFKTGDGGIAIQSLNSKDATIWNNRFSGTGNIGVMIDGDAATGTYAENARLFNNNFSYSKYSDATVYLGEYSSNCKVTGVKIDQVVDEGVNNSIIGTMAHESIMKSGKQFQKDFKTKKGYFIKRRNN